jgi:hypothetical protein
MFYTDGHRILNRDHMQMPADTALTPFFTRNSTQSTVIAPVFGTPNQYYVFGVENWNSAYPARGRCYYSIVDMELDGGYGDIVPSTLATPFDSFLAEKIITVAGDNCNLWLLLHRKYSAQFLAYEITSAGISATPVVSSVGSGVITNYSIGAMKVSPDRHKIVTAAYSDSGTTCGVELFDFNPATGVVSNARLINLHFGAYGAEFSPDGLKLYTTHYDLGFLYQYDLTVPTTAAIVASEYLVTGGISLSTDLRLGPDNKVYLRSPDSYSHLARMNNPNLAGSACGFADLVVPLSNLWAFFGLGNHYWENPLTITSGSGSFTMCVGTTISLSTVSSGGTWLASDSSIATVTTSGVVTGVAAGTTVIKFIHPCGTTAATITVAPPPTPIAGPIHVCAGQTTTITDSVAGGSWSSSNSAYVCVSPVAGVAKGMGTGSATITYAIGSCRTTVIVTVDPSPYIYGKSKICEGATVTLSAGTGGTWSISGSGAATINSMGQATGVAVGTAIVTYVLANGCFDTMAVSVVNCLEVDDAVGGAEIKLYPNPATNNLIIEIPDEHEMVVTITDLLGRTIKTVRAAPVGGRVQVNVGDMVPGNYVVRVESRGRIYRSKITIAR